MGQTEKFSGFRSGEYGGQSAGVQIFTNNCWVVLAVWASTKSAKIFHQDASSGPRGPDHMLSQKLLVDISIDPFAGRNQLDSLNP